MKLERSNIKNPIWRKKVDGSILEGKNTPIPQFLWDQWNIEEIFSKVSSKKNPKSQIKIIFETETYIGNITHSIKSNRYRLFIPTELGNCLKDAYSMSYMRYVEEKLRKKKAEYKGKNIEDDIPFWEFLDIEFNCETKTAIFTAHYTQKPLFTELFREITRSHVVKDIENTIDEKGLIRINKQDWKPRQKLSMEIDAKNVIYNLIDLENRLFYVGEAESLQKRLGVHRNEIPNWTHYRFDSFPNNFSAKERVAIERMMIRLIASLIENDKNIKTMKISNFQLTNKKIDI